MQQWLHKRFNETFAFFAFYFGEIGGRQFFGGRFFGALRQGGREEGTAAVARRKKAKKTNQRARLDDDPLSDCMNDYSPHQLRLLCFLSQGAKKIHTQKWRFHFLGLNQRGLRRPTVLLTTLLAEEVLEVAGYRVCGR
jgi:hypothetical protein